MVINVVTQLKEHSMKPINFDVIVKTAASKVTEKDVDTARREVDSMIEGRAWNMNQPLNMIAYEDQK